MKITSLELKNFRNYDYLKINFNENVNLILGNNAQGKTNLIEAIYITSMGKSDVYKRQNEDLPTLGFPIIATFNPSLIILPVSAESIILFISK